MTIGVQGRTYGSEDEATTAAYVLRGDTSWCEDRLIVMTYKNWERGIETTTNYRPLPPYKLTEISPESTIARSKLKKKVLMTDEKFRRHIQEKTVWYQMSGRRL